jgi:hypothetical protein
LARVSIAGTVSGVSYLYLTMYPKFGSAGLIASNEVLGCRVRSRRTFLRPPQSKVIVSSSRRRGGKGQVPPPPVIDSRNASGVHSTSYSCLFWVESTSLVVSIRRTLLESIRDRLGIQKLWTSLADGSSARTVSMGLRLAMTGSEPQLIGQGGNLPHVSGGGVFDILLSVSKSPLE